MQGGSRAQSKLLGQTRSFSPSLFSSQALEIIRGCKGLNIVGCDLVEVAPMYDVSGESKEASFGSVQSVLGAGKGLAPLFHSH